ncbi:unnamed protein product [Didymodactylos carnosus]|uniref:Uncharacterized protein n=1 Tax=Didymodactylos carnosus TaxID=1234261 RepID=A0A814XH30_9BILA|nr:unnamed protein product [Didymodactylos carnosus]CAF1548896.1 unnamed protein product [Didymodactylos carnosus]CAF3980356.1 unnamed protein product [Didymodactylos carnosus]CAF4338495.1 unnamed protein product [Didymodactylos carnosus]
MGNTSGTRDAPLEYAQQGVHEKFGRCTYGTTLNDDRTTATFSTTGAEELHGDCQVLSGRLSYASGCHRIRIRIEQLRPFSYFSQPKLYVGISNARVNLGGDIGGYWHNIEDNDVFELNMNCDQRLIRVVGSDGRERRANVDLNEYPLPWQLRLAVRGSSGVARLLP